MRSSSAWKPNYAGRGIVPGRSDHEKGFILPKEPAPKMTTYQRATAAIERYWEQRGSNPHAKQDQQQGHASPGRPGGVEVPGGERDIAHKTREACWKDSVNLEQVPGWWQPSYPGTPRDLQEKETVRVRGIPGYTGSQAKANSAAAQPDQAARTAGKPSAPQQGQYAQQAAYDHDEDTLASALQDQLSVQRIHGQPQPINAPHAPAFAVQPAAAPRLGARVSAQQQPGKPWMQPDAPAAYAPGSYPAPSLPASAGAQYDAYGGRAQADQLHAAGAARGPAAAQPANTDYIQRSPPMLNTSHGADGIDGAAGLDCTWGSGSGMATAASSTMQGFKTASGAANAGPHAPAAYRQEPLQPETTYLGPAVDTAAAFKQAYAQQRPQFGAMAAGRPMHGPVGMASAGRPATQSRSDFDAEQESPRFFDDGVELPLQSFQASQHQYAPASGGSVAHDRDVNRAPAAPAATWQPTHLPQHAAAQHNIAAGSYAGHASIGAGFAVAAGGAAHAAARAVGAQYGRDGISPRRASAALLSDSPRLAVQQLTASVGPNTSTYAASYKPAGTVQAKAAAVGSSLVKVPYSGVGQKQLPQQQGPKHVLLPDTRRGIAAYGGVRNNASNLY